MGHAEVGSLVVVLVVGAEGDFAAATRCAWKKNSPRAALACRRFTGAREGAVPLAKGLSGNRART